MAGVVNTAFLSTQLNILFYSIIVDKEINFESVTGMSSATFVKTKEMAISKKIKRNIT